MRLKDRIAEYMREDLTKLKNIGPKSADRLLEAGIESREQIEALGSVEVYRRLSEIYPASLTMLWALQGALLDLPYNRLPKEMKAALLDELEVARNDSEIRT
jgi:DNA transformation protein